MHILSEFCINSNLIPQEILKKFYIALEILQKFYRKFYKNSAIELVEFW